MSTDSRAWLQQARCASAPTAFFFAEHGEKSLTNPTKKLQRAWDKAKDFCYDCPVMLVCARNSVGEVDGVWGGLDPAQRYEIRVNRARRLRNLPPERKIRYGRQVFNMRRNQDITWPDTARQMGINVSTARYLLTWYTGYLKEAADGASSDREQAA